MSLFGPPNVKKLAQKRNIAGLSQALGYQKDSFVRLSAAQALGNLGDISALEPLIKTLGDRDESVRTAAIAALGALGDGRALPPLVAALTGTAWRVRQAAAEALGSLGDPRALAPLIQALDDSEPQVRQAVAGALGWLRDPRAVAPLIRALGDDQGDVRRASAESLDMLGEPKWKEYVTGEYQSDFTRLGTSGDPRALEPLVRALGTVTHQDPRIQIIKALGALKDPRAIEPLIGILENDPTASRAAAAEALGKLGDHRAVEPLLAALGSNRNNVRKAAAEALGYLNAETTILPLIKSLGDEKNKVRKAAAETLDQLGETKWKHIITDNLIDDIRGLAAIKDPRAVFPLINTLRNRNEEIVQAASEMIVKLGACAVEPLIAALGHESSKIRAAAAQLLSNLGDTRAVDPLIQTLRDMEDIVRKSAAEALVKLRGEDQHAVELLIWLLENEDSSIRIVTVKTLGDEILHSFSLSNTRVVELIVQALADRESSVRTAAAEALVKLIGKAPHAVELLIKFLDNHYSSVRTTAARAQSNQQIFDPGTVPRAVELLIMALEDEDPILRKLAVVTLGILRDTNAVLPLIKALGDQYFEIRKAAAEALDLLGESQWKPIITGEMSKELEGLIKSKDPRAVVPISERIDQLIRILSRQLPPEQLIAFIKDHSADYSLSLVSEFFSSDARLHAKWRSQIENQASQYLHAFAKNHPLLILHRWSEIAALHGQHSDNHFDSRHNHWDRVDTGVCLRAGQSYLDSHEDTGHSDVHSDYGFKAPFPDKPQHLDF
ncbi:MAG TPA: HEAT repeat domain-containing protein [Acidobacteriota bacterium]|nr:HEAT repeat domain-containing protein [Acidobacteriota bacterium]